MILTTLVYLQRENQILLMHRTKKKQDLNKGKWIAIGGKVKEEESPKECAIRETYEETGYIVHDLQLVGFVTFPKLYYGEDELMFIYKSSQFSGKLKDCDEGELWWFDKEEIKDLPQWEGDHHYLKWLDEDFVHQAKVIYKEGKLVSFINEH